MTDGISPAAAPAAGAPDAGAAGAPAAAAELSPQGAGSSPWFDSLPDDLKGDETLRRYADVEALARGHLETKRLASSRVPHPGDTAESLKAFGDALRPQDAAAYDIPVPEGAPTEFADAFRAKAHEMGIPPAWAKGLAEWNNEFVASALAAEEAKGQQEVDAFKQKFGKGYDEKLAQVQAWLPRMGIDLSSEDLAKLDSKLGSGNLMAFMFQMHDRVGDLGLPGGDLGGQAGFGAMSPEQADKAYTEKLKDASWRAKAQVEGSAEAQEALRLTRLIAQGRMRTSR